MSKWVYFVRYCLCVCVHVICDCVGLSVFAGWAVGADLEFCYAASSRYVVWVDCVWWCPRTVCVYVYCSCCPLMVCCRFIRLLYYIVNRWIHRLNGYMQLSISSRVSHIVSPADKHNHMYLHTHSPETKEGPRGVFHYYLVLEANRC